jgi:predicted PurR-regulated permease PerM
MKLQHLAIIFVIIILPITMVVSSYIQTQIDTITLQTSYSAKLQTATYDAIKAFQLNTINNKYSSVSDSKISDIEATISAFYDSLASSMGASGYDEDTLKQFIPAMLYTMYDGYYIYGKYYNYSSSEYQY